MVTYSEPAEWQRLSMRKLMKVEVGIVTYLTV